MVLFYTTIDTNAINFILLHFLSDTTFFCMHSIFPITKAKQKREAVIVITLKEARYVMPATEYDPGKKRVIDLSSSTASPRRVAIETADGETVVYFDSTYKINSLLAHYPAASRSLKEMAIS